MAHSIEILAEGQGELLGWRDPDENRAWVRDHKPRGLIDKQMGVPEAIARFVHDGDYLAIGGFGHIRVPMALIYEIVRQASIERIGPGDYIVFATGRQYGGRTVPVARQVVADSQGHCGAAKVTPYRFNEGTSRQPAARHWPAACPLSKTRSCTAPAPATAGLA